MKLYSLLSTGHPISDHGSTAAAVHHIARVVGPAQLVVIELEPDGVLGRHEAAAEQLFLVLAGGGWVSGQGSMELRIEAGMAAHWAAGESHETRAGGEGLRAVVLEGQLGDLGESLLDAPAP